MSEERGLSGSRTAENLKTAFTEEAALAARARAFAELAEHEGEQALAAAFRDLSEGGETLIQGSLDFLRSCADPDSGIAIAGARANLRSLIHTEARLGERVYAQMARAARDEGFPDAASWFETLEKLKASRLRRLRELGDV